MTLALAVIYMKQQLSNLIKREDGEVLRTQSVLIKPPSKCIVCYLHQPATSQKHSIVIRIILS